MELSVRLNKASMLSGGGQKLGCTSKDNGFPQGERGIVHIVRGRGGGLTNILLRLIITFRAIDRHKDKGKDFYKDFNKDNGKTKMETETSAKTETL